MQLEARIAGWGAELDLSVQFFQTNHEGAFVEELHRLEDTVDGLILNPGAWTHYSLAIRDALEIAGIPAVEVHLSDIGAREEWRQVSVVARPVRRHRRRQRPGRLSRGARAAARRAGRMSDGGAGRASDTRADRLAALLDEREVDALLVTDLVNVRYLTGYTGSNGAALVGVGGLRCFVTDFRYVTQAEQQVHGFERRVGEQDLLDDAIAALPAGDVRLGIEDAAHVGADVRRACARRCRRASSWFAPAGRSSSCARSRTRPRSRRSAPPPSWPTPRWSGRSATVWPGARSAPSRSRSSRRCAVWAPSGRASRHDRRARRARRPAARGAARGRDRARRARDDRLGRTAGRLLLGLHAHVRRRRQAVRARPRGLRARAARAAGGPGRGPSRRARARRRRRGPRGDRGGRARRALRPRPRPRRRPGDPRGAAPLEGLRRDPRRRQRRDGRAGRLPSRRGSASASRTSSS